MAEAHSSLLLAKTASANADVRGTHPKAARDGEANPVPSRPKPWTVPARGLVVFHGPGKTARLSHYFLPPLLLQGKRVLLLDGANSADPRLMARLARERGVPFEQFSRQIQLARAFTCFQLTELIARVPRFTAEFPADVLVVTALPELYYDEDVRDWNARVAFEQALRDLRRWACHDRRPLAVAVFSSIPSFTPSPARRRFFPQTCAAATEVWEFSLGPDSRLELSCSRAQPRLEGGNAVLSKVR